jgi:hypothetical protein
LNAFFTHAQLAFCAHSGSQPQAGPPGAPSSQYQPFGQRASPHGVQVPSSHVARAGAGAAFASSSPSLAAAFGGASACVVARGAEDSAGFWAPPHAALTAAKTNEPTRLGICRPSERRAADIDRRS